ncbi:hypothetical protein MBANPS3_007392 [Mucor bainieri]
MLKPSKYIAIVLVAFLATTLIHVSAAPVERPVSSAVEVSDTDKASFSSLYDLYKPLYDQYYAQMASKALVARSHEDDECDDDDSCNDSDHEGHDSCDHGDGSCDDDENDHGHYDDCHDDGSCDDGHEESIDIGAISATSGTSATVIYPPFPPVPPFPPFPPPPVFAPFPPFPPSS